LNPEPKEDFLTCVGSGLFAAGAISLVALVSLSVGMTLSLLGLLEIEDASPRTALIVLSSAVSGYFAAGIIGGAAYYVLQPLSSSLLGRLVVGGVVATILYAGVGVTGVVAEVYAGISFLDVGTVVEGLTELAVISPLLGFFTGPLAVLLYWRD
jgi:hypothetical protein